MNARWPVHDRVNAAATTPAATMAMKAGALKKDRSRLTGLREADGAAECQAGVTCGDTSSIDQQPAQRFGRRYVRALMRKSKCLGQSRGARGEARARGGGRASIPALRFQMCREPTVSTRTVGDQCAARNILSESLRRPQLVYRFRPSQSQTARPMRSSRSRPFSQGSLA